MNEKFIQKSAPFRVQVDGKDAHDAMMLVAVVSLMSTALLPTALTSLSYRRNFAPVCCADFASFSVDVAVQLEDGGSELVTLSSAGDVADVASAIAERHTLSNEQRAALEADLDAQWELASADAPDIYMGPMPTDNELLNSVASIELSGVGLKLDVAESVVSGGGLGLFLRCLADVESVTLDEGTAVCGYAQGEMRHEPDSDGGKSVAFALDSPEAVVWLDGSLRTVGDLLRDGSDFDGIAGHTAVIDDTTGDVVDIMLDPSFEGPRYFVPAEPQPQPFTMGSLGQMANDLAYGTAGLVARGEKSSVEADVEGGSCMGKGDDEADYGYEKSSSEANVLVLVFRLERDTDQPRVLVPTRPISTLSRPLTFVNDVPMELGCSYGNRYWKNRRRASQLQRCMDLRADDARDEPDQKGPV